MATFDVTDHHALQRWIQHAAESTGRLDVLVNNAGFGKTGEKIADGDPEFWKAMLDVNVLALAVGCQAAIKAMRATKSEGNIINISSVAAIRRESGVYGATKHAVNCINSTLRQELEDDTIRVTSISVGPGLRDQGLRQLPGGRPRLRLGAHGVAVLRSGARADRCQWGAVMFEPWIRQRLCLPSSPIEWPRWPVMRSPLGPFRQPLSRRLREQSNVCRRRWPSQTTRAEPPAGEAIGPGSGSRMGQHRRPAPD